MVGAWLDDSVVAYRGQGDWAWSHHPDGNGLLRYYHGGWYVGTGSELDRRSGLACLGDGGGFADDEAGDTWGPRYAEDACADGAEDGTDVWSGLLPEEFKREAVPPLLTGEGVIGPGRFGVCPDGEAR